MAEHEQHAGLTVEAVRRIARLSRLALDEERAQRLRGELGAVLGYVDRLGGIAGEVGLDDRAVGLDGLRGDDPGETLAAEAVRSLAAEADEAGIVVPRVIDAGGGA